MQSIRCMSLLLGGINNCLIWYERKELQRVLLYDTKSWIEKILLERNNCRSLTFV